jgi:hypothetical protein
MALGDFSTDNAPEEHTPKATEGEKSPIDRLVPQSELHNTVLQYLLRRLNYSERTMTQFYSRWNASERKIQAYINLPDYENQLKQMNKTGAPPAAVSITIPYSYATIWTIVTYLIHTFCGQKPIFQVSAYKEESIQATAYMETILQYNADHTRLIMKLIQWFLDAEIYGVGAVRCLWEEEKANRTIWKNQSPGGILLPRATPQMMRQREEKTVFEGNKVTNIDPFMFFPDPRVPMSEVNKRGEFVFWRSFEGKHVLLRNQAQGLLKWIDNIANMPQGIWGELSGKSVRALVAEGQSSPGDPQLRDIRATPYYQLDQCSIEIVPSELGLGDKDEPEKWLFTIGNKSQIIQAEPLDYDHGRHPVAVVEPSTFGYAFGQPGTMDFLGPIQDTLSWFINSHMHNVRTAINNMFVVDPSMVEIQDLKTPGPGKIIRLKRSAYGQDVKSVLTQLQVQDVTKGHIEDMQVFQRIGDILAAVGDNMRGIQDEGGRKTATEIRTSGEAGASRLAARARLISAQGMVDLAEQMSLNIQQMMSQTFYLQVVGQKGMENPIPISPQMVAGDFFFPVNDGTLPIDKTALLAVWKDIWMAITQNPLLAQKYDEGKLFEYVAEIGGAKNISAFRVSMAPDQQVQNGAAAGNLVPLGPPGPRAPGPNTPRVGGGAPGPGGVSLNAGQLGPGRIGPGTAG